MNILSLSKLKIMNNNKLAGLLLKLQVVSAQNEEEDTFTNLNAELSQNLRMHYGGTNTTCNGNTACDGNGTCTGNSSCYGNGVCGTTPPPKQKSLE
jgi:hypothetical protein